ncbi:MlaD family protein [Nocardia sp. alder85J]|uniref:MlaD family protein n=1 Tax=Nocardia sp. alder85J TaxID=2862949 RepID=UPI001CD3CE6E|nr:MlaD family protein [Nocardia sp. alder85J]MCX4095209.1 MlaD family protein [Nocardia sp. alder85J]
MRLETTRSGAWRAAVLAVPVLALAAAGCSAGGLDQVPLPAPSIGHSYRLTATFANALNLPAKAPVKVNGADVGQVESMRARDYAAVVTVRVRSEVSLPVGTTAELRSATPLGDVFIALTPPDQAVTGGPVLHDGDSIPQSATAAAATIEEVLTRAALLVNGGVIRDLTKVINGAGTELDGRGDRLGDLIAQTTDLVRKLAARSDQIRTAVHDAAALTDTVAGQQSTLNDAVAAAGPALDAIGSNTRNIVDLVGRLSRISALLEKFPSINGTGKRSIITDLNNLAAGMNTAANDPRANLDSLNQTFAIVGAKVGNSTGASADADIIQLAVGAGPDPNFPGTPEARVPDQTDWANFVGSLAYTLGRLHDRVIGPGR